MSEVLFLYVTAASMEEARELAQVVVGERLAACANILGAIESVYWWDGAVQSGQEVAMIVKTTQIQFEAVKERICAVHSYECPCIVALSVAGGHQPFLDWVAKETGG